MTVLVLTLAGPLQAWGSSSRFTTRATDDAPTKSGVIGLLAAARGLRRTDPLEDLLELRFGVRLDQPGELVRDFQTARSLDEKESMPLSYRFYRSDARYLVTLEAGDELVQNLVDVLARPAYPLYLGRRSCPPSEPILPSVRDGSLERVLLDEPWCASAWWKRRQPADASRLEFRIDAVGATGELDAYVLGETVQRDEPVSFDPARRQYGWRTVQHGWIPVAGVPAPSVAPPWHDPMGVV